MRYLHIGGIVAAGFDPTGEFLLVISHSGRGLYSTRTWERIARDTNLAYPENGVGIGIGPINGQVVPVAEMDYKSGKFQASSPNGKFFLDCESSRIEVLNCDA